MPVRAPARRRALPRRAQPAEGFLAIGRKLNGQRALREKLRRGRITADEFAGEVDAIVERLVDVAAELAG